MYSMNWYHFVLYQSIALTNHSCRRFSTAILPIITQGYTPSKRMHVHTHTHTHTYIHTHTQSKAKPSAAGMWSRCGHLCTTQVLWVSTSMQSWGRTSSPQEAVPCLTGEGVGTRSPTWTFNCYMRHGQLSICFPS